MALSSTPFAQDWLDRFSEAERPAAAQLADAVLLVSHRAFQRSLESLLDELATGRGSEDLERPMALYAERAVMTQKRMDPELGWPIVEALPYFPGAGKGRATGKGVPAIDPSEPEVGSEGLIANFITGYERLHRNRVLNHPGPDALRKQRPSHMVIVTDFVGSGERVWKMVDAFWRVATLRSWHSYGRIRFAVVAYSGTEDGLRRVRSHNARPDVRLVQACPTVYTEFKGKAANAIHALCKAHPPDLKSPLGYDWGGALIAFAHGMPNNAPPILHSHANGWTPLFANRSALAADTHFPASMADALAEQARTVLQIRAAEQFLAAPANRRWIATMLVLAAVQAGARTSTRVSARARLPMADVEEILVFTRIARWTDHRNALTVLGGRELTRLNRRRARSAVLPTAEQPHYYPTQLRAR
ncbi:hypothetical protein [Brevundimonas nasdae]|uniref:Uncharacterized protein n=1 Tax=Brevundimonas nasdae TaxID=172043 RepID=A0ACD4VMA5_9CAUL|nr:hypothetical protein [Brevundimonas nasdae]WOB77669.1 hypothetical protein PZA08_10020 [Brevundimonas nasdae]